MDFSLGASSIARSLFTAKCEGTIKILSLVVDNLKLIDTMSLITLIVVYIVPVMKSRFPLINTRQKRKSAKKSDT
ncbi:hypothetical protein BpHYR1_040160 [Brachionus plicatilis]|uniref:Uncharacterized protein n=1 Tax=Brachionus plicatilis TaxID=10195 RepID=A0A3M7SJX5_BRAPC|nr:hypothetical protein BpHYR1_040160 [Brachionus plicatilis]